MESPKKARRKPVGCSVQLLEEMLDISSPSVDATSFGTLVRGNSLSAEFHSSPRRKFFKLKDAAKRQTIPTSGHRHRLGTMDAKRADNVQDVTRHTEE